MTEPICLYLTALVQKDLPGRRKIARPEDYEKHTDVLSVSLPSDESPHYYLHKKTEQVEITGGKIVMVYATHPKDYPA